jgi:hypothetical protein
VREQPTGLGEVVWDGQYRDAPGHPGRGPAYTLDRYRTADDRAVEAMLASVREPCTASQLASGLEWTLPRTVDALEHLEAALANTGQTLTRIGHHHYMLGPRAGLPEERRERFAAAVVAGVSLPLDYVRLNASAVRGPT